MPSRLKDAPLPLEMLYGFGEVSMMSMDWGHMASQVPHWMHFEAGSSAACQELEALDELVVLGSALQVQQVHGDGDLHASGQSFTQ